MSRKQAIGLAEILESNNTSLAVSFYLADRLSTIEIKEGQISIIDSLIPRPTGIAVTDSGVWVGARQGISFFRKLYYEAERRWLYRQTNTKHLGFIDCHELVAIADTPVFANTLCNCLATLSADKDFHVFFKPGFIEKIVVEDRAHINGIAVEKGVVRHLSCFSPHDVPGRKSWGKNPFTGTVWDVVEDYPVLSGLSIPHSPRIVDGELYVCDSGKGRVVSRDRTCSLGSITRGLAVVGDYLIVGTSVARKDNRNPQIDRDLLTVNRCGIHAINLDSFIVVDSYYFDSDRTEIFDIQVMPSNHYLVTVDSPVGATLHLF